MSSSRNIYFLKNNFHKQSLQHINHIHTCRGMEPRDFTINSDGEVTGILVPSIPRVRSRVKNHMSKKVIGHIKHLRILYHEHSFPKVITYTSLPKKTIKKWGFRKINSYQITWLKKRAGKHPNRPKGPVDPNAYPNPIDRFSGHKSTLIQIFDKPPFLWIEISGPTQKFEN